MLLLVGLGLADVVTEPEPLVSRDWRKGEKKPTRHKDHPLWIGSSGTGSCKIDRNPESVLA
jgi:hypothetical protein